jgi:hypothetical protein
VVETVIGIDSDMVEEFAKHQGNEQKQKAHAGDGKEYTKRGKL